MKVDNAANWFVRLMVIALLVSFLSGACLVASWILKAILRAPGHATLDQYGYLSTCVLVVGLLLYAIGRVATWSSTRADGSLVPPPILYAVLGPLCALWGYGACLELRAAHYLQAFSLLLAVAGALAMMREVRQRSRMARQARKPAVSD